MKLRIFEWFRSFMLISLVLLMTSLSVFAGEDEPSGWAEEGLNLLKESEKFRQEAFGDYKEPITRENFIYLAVRLYELTTGMANGQLNDIEFIDTDDSYAIKGARLGITKGVEEGKFGPDQLLTREQLATFIVKTLELSRVPLKEADSYVFNDHSEISYWARKYVYKAKANGIIGGVGQDMFNPQGQATVEQALTIIKNIMSNEELGMKENLNCAAFFDDVDVPSRLVYDRLDYLIHGDEYANIGVPSQFYFHKYFREGLLSGVETFDFTDNPMSIKSMRSIYRSLYYEKNFMQALGRDFELEYVKRDEDYGYVIKVHYGKENDLEFLEDHFQLIEAFEDKYGLVTSSTATMPLEIDLYNEGEQEKFIVLDSVEVKEKTRNEIVNDFAERLRKAFLNRDAYLNIGRDSMTVDEVTEAFHKLYFDREFVTQMNQFHGLSIDKKSGKNVVRVMLTYSEGENYLEKQLAIIDEHEGITTPEKPVEVVVTPPAIDESVKGFQKIWTSLNADQVTTLDVKEFEMTQKEFNSASFHITEKAREEYGQDKTVAFYYVLSGDYMSQISFKLVDEADAFNPEIFADVKVTKPSEDPNDKIEIAFKNKDIEAYVRQNLSDPNDIITQAILSSYDRLYLEDLISGDLEDLKYFENLKILHIRRSPVKDINVLSHLSKLEEFNLIDTQVKDISVLSQLSHLDELLLSGNSINSIEALAGLSNLKYLALYEYNIHDFDKLEGLDLDTFNFIYDIDLNNLIIAYKEMRKVVDSKTNSSMSDLNKITVLNEYLIDTVEYDYDNFYANTSSNHPSSYSPYGLVSTKKMVCAGYAHTLNALAGMADLEAEYVENSDINHAWSRVKINGKWREFDATWNDVESPEWFRSINSDESFWSNVVPIRNKYFNMTPDEMAKDHGLEKYTVIHE
ncbi:hypothetical protein EZV73_13155 [Acidaminobacter sp. JC074]|uniref:S-layer homology domain-containing protein n=1 Tax=Acidaminobacter sp. JC074 TaxID=2530199 RepID=UPI001F112777|nr:S-layer homology domain-containing protein [Acidaminobacter sp. JC074]MCH4888534.1 hypothetical protein [Acidaminobacter sp. JC074]